MKIMLIAGARPNFMKIAPIIRELEKEKINYVLIHTGQHYNKNMSQLFFDDLEIKKPEYNLKIGSGTQARQTGRIMIALEPIMIKEKPDLVLVVGDVNSTLAGALTASKLHIKVAHVESGLRSFDREMPEEINRVLTDHISDYLFVTEPSGIENLQKEGITNGIYLVGNVMIDSLLKNKEKALKSKILENLNLNKQDYAVLTLHRPSNVDNKEIFAEILKALNEISKKIKIVYPIHPRARKNAEIFNLNLNNLIITKPQSYLDFLNLVINSKFILTDSGGIQEETTFLGIPCLTLRENTERKITIEKGSNKLVKIKNIKYEIEEILNGNFKQAEKIEWWDGKTAERIVQIIKEISQ